MTSTTATPPKSAVYSTSRSATARYRNALWLLTSRDLRVRYSTSALGYIWSILDPLLMSLIYWFVFTKIFHRGGAGEDPYITFLLTALLPWMWFTGAVSDSTRAFTSEARLIRSTTIPRSIWVARIDLSKGIEFLLSIPVLALFAIFSGAHLHWQVVYFPLAVIMEGALIYGLGLIIAPLVVFFRDLERAVKLILRFAFYASPIVYSPLALSHGVHDVFALNPLAGIIGMYRAAFFPKQLDLHEVIAAAIVTLVVLAIGVAVFRRSERRVLKEL
ncbi:ABC transporter permease [Curtobacterium ammoniigenes]|uniref:ABC transporter permease n=1 Tax=Curtobacterium ammoniigenes TaxID=395387 RepID=UPI00083606AC|nr:ABC transporter permease [Curtobacterium ammoniigenes]